MRRRFGKRRRGAVLVLVALLLIPLLAFVALAVDLGLLTLARTECQQAADAAAMAGARTLNGYTANGANNNYAAAGPKAVAAATANSVLGVPLQPEQVSVEIGRYVYVPANRRFEGQFPGPSDENWSLVRARVNVDVSSKMGFSRIFSYVVPNMQAVATSAHRPRDVAVILDFSGSMRFSSLLGIGISGNRTTNNPDNVIPVFGHYSSSSAGLRATSFSPPYQEANISTTTSDGRRPVVECFYTDTNGTRAFFPAPAGYGSTPAGDNYLRTNLNKGSSYAQTLAQVLNLSSVNNSTKNTLFEAQGYQYSAMTSGYSGYTLGPGYYGKTFFIWPPDPRPQYDWRKRFFTYPGSVLPMDDNSRLWTSGTGSSAGNWRAPSSSTYAINYNAILQWIKQAPCPFPPVLRSGRIVYYDQIPDTINTSTWPPTDLNQRFWKDYIDYVLGVVQVSASTYNVICNGSTGLMGYGTDFTWGSVRITAKSSLSGKPPPYMRYDDNPKRPRLHFWFGPLSMVDFLGNYNMWGQVSPYGSRFAWWPGTCTESPMYGCKLGIRAALTDCEKNHPNDFFSLIYFSVPRTSASDSSGRRFNRVRVGLGRDYARMQEYLWYPPSTVGNANATVRPYDPDNLEHPRALGGTCYAMPLMLAYNQFSESPALLNYNGGAPAGDAGGRGRRGAQKIIIFETDGAPNTTAGAQFVNNGPYLSYYRVRYNSANPGGSEYPTGVSGYADNASQVTSQIFSICQQICALDTAGSPGFSTPSKPVLIHCIGFGAQFDPSSPGQAAAVATLDQMQQIGSVTDGMPSYKIIYGTDAEVASRLQQAFTKILQSGVQVSLIE